VAQPKVGTEGERGEEFGHSYAGGFHVPIVRLRRSFVRRRTGAGTKRSTWRTSFGSSTVGRHLVLVYFYPSRRN
jgi:hypothetical protein